jgi:molybdopterin converting factor small subunit
MPVRVLFFGATADIAGKREIEIPVTDGLTANSALNNVLEHIPGLASHKLHISINQQYATGDESIRDGDELAIFTAVSGG